MKKKNKKKDTIVNEAFETAKNNIDTEDGLSSSFTITEREKEELNTLCEVLGMGRSSCINFATKYFSFLLQNTTNPPNLPKSMKITSKNPAVEIEYKLSPETKHSIEGLEKKFTEDQLVKLSIIYFFRKLLPYKKWRK